MSEQQAQAKAIQSHAVIFAARWPWSAKPAEILEPDAVYEASLNPPPLAEREGGCGCI